MTCFFGALFVMWSADAAIFHSNESPLFWMKESNSCFACVINEGGWETIASGVVELSDWVQDKGAQSGINSAFGTEYI